MLIMIPHSSLNFNQSQVKRIPNQKHIGLILDEELSFKGHLKVTLDKTKREFNTLQKLEYHIPHQCYKTYSDFLNKFMNVINILAPLK